MSNSKLRSSTKSFCIPAIICILILLVATLNFGTRPNNAYAQEACKTTCAEYGHRDVITDEAACTASCDCPGDSFDKYTIKCGTQPTLICCDCPIITPTPTATPTGTPDIVIGDQGVVLAR